MLTRNFLKGLCIEAKDQVGLDEEGTVIKTSKWECC